MQVLFLSIIRVIWAGVFGWLTARWGIEIDEATKAEVINWTMTVGLAAAACGVEVWVHVLYPKIKAWIEKAKV